MTPFFIGWAGLPRALYGFIAAFVAVIAVAGVAFATLVLTALPPRETGSWDSGDFEGTLVTKPYALVRVPATGNAPAHSVLLVDEWKFGVSLGPEFHDGEAIHVQGYALRRGEVTVLQIAAAPQPAAHSVPAAPALRDGGEQTLSGEIVDSKCWAGAMNPGEGKAHRGCGSLCLLGNIPALFIGRGAPGAAPWYVLADADGNPLDEAIRAHVGELQTLKGHVLDAADLHEFRLEQESVDRLLAFATAATSGSANR
jgi:hypothetical protein